MQLNACISDLLAEYGQEWSRATTSAHRQDLTQFAQWLCDRYQVDSTDEVKPLHITHYRTYMHDSSYAHATVQRKLLSVRTFLRYMRCNAHTSHSLDIYASPVSTQRKKPQFLSFEEMVLLLEAPEKYPRRRIRYRDSAIMYATGMRAVELIGLDLQSIKATDAVVRIHIQRPNPRIVDLDDLVARGALENYLREERPELANDTIPPASSPALFLETSGHRLSRAELRSMLHFYAEQLSLPLSLVVLRTLRNTAIRDILYRTPSNDSDEIKRSLGISSIALQRYLVDIAESNTS